MLQVVNATRDSVDVTDSVTVGVLKAGREYLVENTTLKPNGAGTKREGKLNYFPIWLCLSALTMDYRFWATT
jgi:hypothetical protein